VKTFPGEFLNVDLDIKSRVDPHMPIEALGWPHALSANTRTHAHAAERVRGADRDLT
jgi:hypothetical protein